jgi:hypothetical protein
MTSEDLVSAFRAVLLRHSRSLVDNDSAPTDALLSELVGVAQRHAGEQVPTRPARVKRSTEDAA